MFPALSNMIILGLALMRVPKEEIVANSQDFKDTVLPSAKGLGQAEQSIDYVTGHLGSSQRPAPSGQAGGALRAGVLGVEPQFPAAEGMGCWQGR